MKNIKLIFTMLLVAVLLVACNSAKTTDTASSETKAVETEVKEEAAKEEVAEEVENTVVRVSEFRNLSWSSTYIADALGFFNDEGLTVNYEVYKDGPIAFQGMHAGNSDFCLLSSEPVIKASEAGFESYLILTNTDNRDYAFASAPEIKEIKDLKGKKVFAGMPGSAPYSFVVSLLESAGLTENDVTFMNIDYGAAVSALGNQQIDALFFAIFNKNALLDAVPDANILIDTTIPEEHMKLYGSKYCQTAIVTTTKEYADNNPETVQKFTNASVKALQWMSNHSAEEIAEKLAPYFDGMSKEELAGKIGLIKTSYSSTGEINREGYQTVEDFCFNQKIIENKIGYDNIVQPKFVENALKSM